jgi:hypothetical protein
MVVGFGAARCLHSGRTRRLPKVPLVGTKSPGTLWVNLPENADCISPEITGSWVARIVAAAPDAVNGAGQQAKKERG